MALKFSMFALFIAGASAGSEASCGTIKALYSSESCCEAPAATKTSIQEIVAKDASLVTSSMISQMLFQEIMSSMVSVMNPLPDEINPCNTTFSPEGVIMFEGMKEGLMMQCKDPTKGKVMGHFQKNISDDMSMVPVTFGYGDGELNVVHMSSKPVVLIPASDMNPQFTYEVSQSSYTFNGTHLLPKMTMYAGAYPMRGMTDFMTFVVTYMLGGIMKVASMSGMEGAAACPGQMMAAAAANPANPAAGLMKLTRCAAPFFGIPAPDGFATWNDAPDELVKATIMYYFDPSMSSAGIIMTTAPPAFKIGGALMKV